MLSVIITTYNRKSLLAECLKSILRQKLDEEYEVIVIDNGSTDGSECIFLENQWPGVKFVRNLKRLSLWESKNKGINLSSGDIVAFTDDDCIVSESWLKQIRKALTDNDFAGGPTYPLSNIRFPFWWKDSLNWLIGVNLKPDKDFLPLGSNMAFKKNALGRPQINKSALSGLLLPYAEDRIRITLLIRSGLSMGINKEMIAYHRVPRQRLKVSYLIKRSYWEGAASAALERETKTAFSNLAALAINPVRLVIFLDLNYFFRTIVSLSYMINLLKKPRF